MDTVLSGSSGVVTLGMWSPPTTNMTSASYNDRVSSFSPSINMSRILDASDCDPHHEAKEEDEENVPPRTLFLHGQRRGHSCPSLKPGRPARLGRSRGQLKLSITSSQGVLTVHVRQARQLKSKWTSSPSSYVQISLILGENQQPCHTSAVHTGNQPSFDEQFTLKMMETDQRKRLRVSMYNKEDRENCHELLGCMTFGVRHLTSHKTSVDGWYYLLAEEVGSKKHLQTPTPRRTQLGRATKTPTNQSRTSGKSQRSSTLQSLIPDVNRSLQGLDTTTVVVKRGRHGYGFTVMGSCPVTIGKVDYGSSAASAGLQTGDNVVRINGQNVSRSTADSVAKIVKNSPKQIVLDVVRPGRPFRSSLKTEASVAFEDVTSSSSVTSSNLYEEFPSDIYNEAFSSRSLCPSSASQCSSSLSPASRRTPVGGTPSSRGLNDTLPLRPSQSDNVMPHSRSYRKMSVSSQPSNVGMSVDGSGSKLSHKSERSVRKCSRKTVTSRIQHQQVSIVSEAEVTITTNNYNSLRWDATNESIFFNENQEIYDELPWKPFDCDNKNTASSRVVADEDTYATMCDGFSTDDETFLDVAFQEEASDADESNMSIADYAPSALPEMSFCDLSCRERARQAAASQLLRAEASFIATMQYGIQRYSRPLRHCIMSASEHRVLFQNVEKLVAFSEYHMRQMADGSLSYSDLNSSSERYVDVVGSVYSQRATILCEAYQLYAQGLNNALKLLEDLKTYEQFHTFLSEPAAEAGKPTIGEFLRKPEEHLQTLMVTLRTVLSHTSRDHCDADALDRVVKAFSVCCNKVPTPAKKNTSSSSITSSNTSSGSASFNSKSSGQSGSSSGSKSSTASVDSELLEIQERLVFPSHVTAFQLAAPARHVIYSGELLRVEECQWKRVVVVLFSDLLLITCVEGDSLIVVEDPLPLPDVMNTEFGGSHPCEFTLTAELRTGDHIGWEARHLLLRAPSMEQACTWKSLLEQRIASFRTHRELMTGRSREAVF